MKPETCREFILKLAAKLEPKMALFRWSHELAFECLYQTFGFNLDECGVRYATHPGIEDGKSMIMSTVHYYLHGLTFIEDSYCSVEEFSYGFHQWEDHLADGAFSMCESFPMSSNGTKECIAHALLTKTKTLQNFELLLKKILIEGTASERYMLRYCGHPRYSVEEMTHTINRLEQTLELSRKMI